MTRLDFAYQMQHLLMEEMDGIDETPSQTLVDLQYVPMGVEDQMEHVAGLVVTHTLEEVAGKSVDLSFEDALQREAF